jgi:hypothetical protein
MNLNWNEIIATLGSTAIVVAAIAFLAKAIVTHILKRDLEHHKASLRKSSEEEKLRLENELRKKTETILLSQKVVFDKQLEIFRAEVKDSSSKTDRIREEVVRWANPILAAVDDLQRRLENILQHEGYLVLSEAGTAPVNGWSARYDYYLPSTIYLFGQYFCWIRLLEERLSFELFEKHDLKDAFFERVRAANHKLSGFPLDELQGLSDEDEDRQVFTLEQRAIGELLAINEDNRFYCLGYTRLLDKWIDLAFRERVDP